MRERDENETERSGVRTSNREATSENAAREEWGKETRWERKGLIAGWFSRRTRARASIGAGPRVMYASRGYIKTRVHRHDNLCRVLDNARR